jgi:hypothetical protein
MQGLLGCPRRLFVERTGDKMTKPVGMSKLKDNSRKHYKEHDDWTAGKKIGRKKQEFDKETKTWHKENQ